VGERVNITAIIGEFLAAQDRGELERLFRKRLGDDFELETITYGDPGYCIEFTFKGQNITYRAFQQ
jgi:hypothetical protein